MHVLTSCILIIYITLLSGIGCFALEIKAFIVVVLIDDDVDKVAHPRAGSSRTFLPLQSIFTYHKYSKEKTSNGFLHELTSVILQFFYFFIFQKKIYFHQLRKSTWNNIQLICYKPLCNGYNKTSCINEATKPHHIITRQTPINMSLTHPHSAKTPANHFTIQHLPLCLVPQEGTTIGEADISTLHCHPPSVTSGNLLDVIVVLVESCMNPLIDSLRRVQSYHRSNLFQL